MLIEFLEGSIASHPNFERYMKESTEDGAIPLRFDRVVSASESPQSVGDEALTKLDRLAHDEAAELVLSTMVATWTPEAPGSRRYRALIIARKARPEVDRVVVRLEMEP